MTDHSRRRFVAGIATTGLAGAIGTGTATRGDARGGPPDHANARTRGRLEFLGHELTEDSPMYTFGDVSEDGRWGVVSSWPRTGIETASTLYDLDDLADPTEVHRVESAEGTRSNHVRFDGTRDGLYYRSQEIDDDDVGEKGIEVVDFGWEEGTPDDPVVLAQVETPNTGVHTLSEHPDEEIMYLIDKTGSQPGVIPLDVSDPADPELGELAGPNGYCHATEVDPVRNVLHCAYIAGQFQGYAILDLDEPMQPTEIGRFDYTQAPDYTEVGEPGFESCHHAHFDPERDIAVVGDEIGSGVPGGKHVFDIGWDEGSLEDPQPIGFTTSPDAREMGAGQTFWWTTHFHDILRDGDETLLVDGGYRNGAWMANITDPRNPVPTERYGTTDGAEIATDHDDVGVVPSTPPFAWGAVYNEARDFVFVSDSVTGAFTFRPSAKPARGRDGGGPGNYYDLEAALTDE
ncbi:regulatory P domain-containing protein [Natronococcus sp. A-GB7]|uniref:LVIVD repeat-containing protein n=1 Tax=Natronococcus sp. A-GB7 TaxID=3037649 RepID=UPI00241C92F5|nr:regulatory P domain-containing protein [Natronococcus sp. A-GB7]MDG5818190.1 regulatory P domain-containing protein [Natronococcus sp. A-GB7]